MNEKTIVKKDIINAKKYAQAIFEIAKSKGIIEIVYENLKFVEEIIDLSIELKELLENPTISLIKKKEIIEELFKEKIKEDTLNLLYVIVDKNRINIISSIVYVYKELIDEYKDIIKADVISAVEIKEETKDRLKKELDKKFKKDVKIDYNIDEGIIGGLIIKLGDKIIDGSVRRKIEEIKNKIK